MVFDFPFLLSNHLHSKRWCTKKIWQPKFYSLDMFSLTGECECSVGLYLYYLRESDWSKAEIFYFDSIFLGHFTVLWNSLLTCILLIIRVYSMKKERKKCWWWIPKMMVSYEDISQYAKVQFDIRPSILRNWALTHLPLTYVKKRDIDTENWMLHVGFLLSSEKWNIFFIRLFVSFIRLWSVNHALICVWASFLYSHLMRSYQGCKNQRFCALGRCCEHLHYMLFS